MRRLIRLCRLYFDRLRINHNPRPMTPLEAALTVSGMRGRAARCLNSVTGLKLW